jgi:hypothetical protein
MSRAGVFALLSTDNALHLLGFSVVNFFGGNSADDPPKPFVVVRWEAMETPGFPQRMTGPQIVTVWFHDRDRAYERIDAAIDRTKAILSVQTHYVGTDGYTITQCDWSGDSAELWDDGYQTVTRNTSFRVISRPS